MAVSGNLFANVFDQAFSAGINWPTNAQKMALYTAAPALNTLVTYTTTNEVVGTGYTAGGATLGTKTHTVTAANSFATTNGTFTSGNWGSTLAAVVGNVVKPATPNGFLYECVVAGTTAASAAVLNSGPTVQGATVTDGTVTWSCIGESISIWSSAAATWAASTITAAAAVIYDSVTTNVIALVNFGGNVSSTAATYTVTPPTLGWFWLTPQ